MFEGIHANLYVILTALFMGTVFMQICFLYE